MITIRRSEARGHADHGWLDTRHSFSFADYHDPAHVQFGGLRVLNEDRVAAGAGFPSHSHRDMEILTYVLEGALSHHDSLGNGSTIRPGDIQRMTAGTGVVHSEHNASNENPVHFLQIWILPERKGLAPGYEQRHFDALEFAGRFRCIASTDARDGSVLLHADAALFVARLTAGQGVEHHWEAGRRAYIQIARGGVRLDGEPLVAGDGARIESAAQLRVEADSDAEILLFDLA